MTFSFGVVTGIFLAASAYCAGAGDTRAFAGSLAGAAFVLALYYAFSTPEGNKG